WPSRFTTISFGSADPKYPAATIARLKVRSAVQGIRLFFTSPRNVTVLALPCVCCMRSSACCCPAKNAARAWASAVALVTQPDKKKPNRTGAENPSADPKSNEQLHPLADSRFGWLERNSMISDPPFEAELYSPGRLRILPNSLSTGSISIRPEGLDPVASTGG